MAMLGIKLISTITVQHPVQAPISFALESITQSGKIYINDSLLWSDLSVHEPASRSQYVPRQWSIAPVKLK